MYSYIQWAPKDFYLVKKALFLSNPDKKIQPPKIGLFLLKKNLWGPLTFESSIFFS